MIRAGHKIGVLTTDTRIHFAMHSAAATQGFVMVPLPPNEPMEALAAMITEAGVDVLMADEKLAGMVELIRAGRPALIVNEKAEPVSHLAGKLVEPSSPADLRMLVRTSGTSGQAHWVAITGRQLKAHRRAALKRLHCDASSVWLAALPMWHIGGIALVDRCLHGGGHLVIQQGSGVDATVQALEQHPITHLSLVPTQLKRLLAAGARPPASLQCVLVGGDNLPTPIAQAALEHGWPIFATYGLTEACSQVATATPQQLRDAPGTSGRPLDGVEVTVHDNHGQPVPEGATGEIIVAGDPVSEPPARTGDVGFIRGGFLFVVGRSADRIVTGGENVNAADVEQVLCGCPGVEAVAVVGLPDAEWGQRVVAVYEGTAAPQTVAEFARTRLGRHARPKEYRNATLPRTPSGKVQKAVLRPHLSAESN